MRLKNLFDLTGKTAVIIGGNSVLGGAMARVSCFQADATSREQLERVKEKVLDSFVTGALIRVDGGFGAMTI